MMPAVIWLLIAVGGSNASPNTLAVLNDREACVKAAKDIYQLSASRNGSPYLYGYCIPVAAKAVVK